MNTSKDCSNDIRAVIVDFKSYLSKARLKKTCVGCSYSFKPENKYDYFCDQCKARQGKARQGKARHRLYGKIQVTKAMLAAGGGYGYH